MSRPLGGIVNYNPNLSTGSAICITLLAAAIWGTWFVSLKHLDDHPLDGFIITLFSSALLFVWSVGFALDGNALLTDIQRALAYNPMRVLGTLVGGGTYVIGLRLSLAVGHSIGLSLMQPIYSSVSILAGTLLAALIGGMPANISLGNLIIPCLLLVGAVVSSTLAGYFRGQHPHSHWGVQTSAPVLWKSLGRLIVGSLFIPAYPLALSFGLRSSTQPEGMSVLPFMTLMATGAFVGALFLSGRALTRQQQWRVFFSAPARYYGWGIVSGLFHYSGNILHAFATVQLSSSITWPIGVSSGFWLQALGLLHGEFEGASRPAYLALSSALILYSFGVFLIADMLH